VAALVFALHPVHIEPVTWVSAASDTMVTMFSRSPLGISQGRSSKRIPGEDEKQKLGTAWWIASLALLACALLTKEMAVVFSALVGIYAWLYPAGDETSPVKRAFAAATEAAPYAVVTLAYVCCENTHCSIPPGSLIPITGCWMSRGLCLWCYPLSAQLVIPLGITGLYYTPYVTTAILTQLVVPVLVLVAVLVGLWYWNRREGHSIVAFAGLWLLIGLAPALYLRNFGNGDFVRDRYMYLPSIGFSILAQLGCGGCRH